MDDSKKKILVVEDEKSISDIIRYNLEKEGFSVYAAYDGEEALTKQAVLDPDLLLLDVMLPKMDGFTVCKKVREKSAVPIIILTAKEEEVDKVLGLELGADDYMTKPFGMRELLARIKANIRRATLTLGPDVDKAEANIREFGNLTIDLNRYEIRKNGEILELTLREFELLRYLAERENKVFSREQLLEEVWGYEYYGDIRTVDVTVRRLREKLEDDSSSPRYIMTKRGSWNLTKSIPYAASVSKRWISSCSPCLSAVIPYWTDSRKLFRRSSMNGRPAPIMSCTSSTRILKSSLRITRR